MVIVEGRDFGDTRKSALRGQLDYCGKFSRGQDGLGGEVGFDGGGNGRVGSEGAGQAVQE